MDKSKIIQTRIGKAWLDANNILWIQILPQANITLTDAEESIQASQLLLQGIEYFGILLDIRKIKFINYQARQYYSLLSTSRSSRSLAIAILVGSPVSQIIGSFFIGLNRPQKPIKLFTHGFEAIKWLKNQLSKGGK